MKISNSNESIDLQKTKASEISSDDDEMLENLLLDVDKSQFYDRKTVK